MEMEKSFTITHANVHTQRQTDAQTINVKGQSARTKELKRFNVDFGWFITREIALSACYKDAAQAQQQQ